MGLDRKKAIEFDWTEEFERRLVLILLDYRLSKKADSNPVSALRFEREHAQGFMQDLRSLMDQFAPSLAADSDITAVMDQMKAAHDGALSREIEKYGGVR